MNFFKVSKSTSSVLNHLKKQLFTIEQTTLFAENRLLLNHQVERKQSQKPAQPQYISASPTLRKPVKRTSKLHQSANIGADENGQRSIIAYSLSEELRIEYAQKLLQIFNEYHIVELPEDISDEVVLLSCAIPDSASITSSITDDLNGDVANIEPRVNDIFLFREGSIVFWGVPYEKQKRIFAALSPLKLEPYKNELIQDEREHIKFELSHTDKSRLVRGVPSLAINQAPVDARLDQFAISHAISQSVKLAIWEALLDQYIESISWVTNNMKLGKDIALTKEQVFKKTGELFELKHNINLASDLLDTPDVYWDRDEQEILYSSLISNLNIKKRTQVINEKLNNCCELMNLLGNHMNDRHHIRLEWMIIILIMVEVLFEISHLFR